MKEPLLAPEHAAAVARSGGGPYRPSNGTEGEMFQARWCAHCTKDDYEKEVYCPILTASMAFGVSDSGYPPELKHDAQGQPCCTAFEAKPA